MSYLRTLKKWPVGKPYPADGISVFYDPDTNDEYQLLLGQLLAGVTGPPPPASTPPASYGKTLSPSLTEVEGIVAAFGSTQMLRTNVLPGVEGDYLTLEIIDGSDGSSSSFDFRRGYARSWYLFLRKDGTPYEAQWPSDNLTITV